MQDKNELLSTMYVLYNLTLKEIYEHYFVRMDYHPGLRKSFSYDGIVYDVDFESSANSTVITLNSSGTGIAIFSNHAHIITHGYETKILNDDEVIDRISEDESTVSLYKDNLVNSGNITKIKDFDKSDLFNLSLTKNDSCVYGYEFLYNIYEHNKFRFCIVRMENLSSILDRRKPLTFSICV